MRLGIGGCANLVALDEQITIYKYGVFNSELSECKEISHAVLDGIISINKECFLEPEIHTKLKRMPSKRKKINHKENSN